jgi:hypothetical protein
VRCCRCCLAFSRRGEKVVLILVLLAADRRRHTYAYPYDYGYGYDYPYVYDAAEEGVRVGGAGGVGGWGGGEVVLAVPGVKEKESGKVKGEGEGNGEGYLAGITRFFTGAPTGVKAGGDGKGMDGEKWEWEEGGVVLVDAAPEARGGGDQKKDEGGGGFFSRLLKGGGAAEKEKQKEKEEEGRRWDGVEEGSVLAHYRYTEAGRVVAGDGGVERRPDVGQLETDQGGRRRVEVRRAVSEGGPRRELLPAPPKGKESGDEKGFLMSLPALPFSLPSLPAALTPRPATPPPPLPATVVEALLLLRELLALPPEPRRTERWKRRVEEAFMGLEAGAVRKLYEVLLAVRRDPGVKLVEAPGVVQVVGRLARALEGGGMGMPGGWVE